MMSMFRPGFDQKVDLFSTCCSAIPYHMMLLYVLPRAAAAKEIVPRCPRKI